MKAVVVNEFGVKNPMSLKEIEEPVPGKGEVKVKIEYAGINPNETYVMTGTYAFFIPKLPFTPGFDGAGTVVETGPETDKFKVGDRVYIAGFGADRNTGTYAQMAVVSQDNVHHLPDNISFEEGAALGIPAVAAYRAVFIRGQVRENETVLIHGASGGVGTLAIQMAKSAGAEVIGTASSEEGKKILLDMGADHAIDHVNAENKKEIMGLTGGKGVDLIIEFLANVNLSTDLEILARYGRVVVVGNRGTIEINPRLMMGKDTDIRGLGTPNYTPEELKKCFEDIGSMLRSGNLKPVIGEIFSLEDANKSHEVLLNRRSKGKMLFKID